MLSFSLSLSHFLSLKPYKKKNNETTKNVVTCHTHKHTHTTHTHAHTNNHPHTRTHINILNRLHLFACVCARPLCVFPWVPSLISSPLSGAPAIAVPSPARRVLHPQNVPHTTQPQRLQRQIAQSANLRVACTSIMMISPPWPDARILVNIWPKANAKLPP